MLSLLEAQSVIEIKNASYAVEPIPAGEFGLAAVRVTKLVNGETYDVIRTRENVVQCSCPDYICRHEGKGTVCKHGAAMVARGLLIPPVSGGSPAAATPPPAAVRPITRQDLAAARTWGLRLPADVPMAVETPAPVVAAVAPVVESIGSDVDLSHFANPAHFADAPAGMEWVTITPTAGVLRPTEPDRVVDPAPVAEQPRPARRPRFVPSVIDEAWSTGFDLGQSGEKPIAPREWSPGRMAAFYRGVEAGQARLHEETLEFHAWLDQVEGERQDEAFGGPEATWHAAETVEAGSRSGHPAFETN